MIDFNLRTFPTSSQKSVKQVHLCTIVVTNIEKKNTIEKKSYCGWGCILFMMYIKFA